MFSQLLTRRPTDADQARQLAEQAKQALGQGDTTAAITLAAIAQVHATLATTTTK